jgi:hypothetical protein
MAGDWIKWVKGLARRPEVLQMAFALGKTRHEVAGLLMEFWEWADDNVVVETTSANSPGFVRIASASLALVDSIIGVAGFAESMSSVGWLHVRSGSLEFPKYGRHNGNSAKRRGLDVDRKRSNLADVPQNFRSDSANFPHEKRKKSGPEKRREEKTEKTQDPPTPLEGGTAEKPPRRPRAPDPATVPIPPPLDVPEFRDVWARWLTYRATRCTPAVTFEGAEMSLRRLAELPPDFAVRCIETSIANGWKGLFPDRFKRGGGGGSRGYRSRHDEITDEIQEALEGLTDESRPPPRQHHQDPLGALEAPRGGAT